MDKLKSLLKITAYITAFIIFECLLHYLQIILVIGLIASVTFRIMELISAIGAVMELFEIATGIEIKDKFREICDQQWKQITQTYLERQEHLDEIKKLRP